MKAQEYYLKLKSKFNCVMVIFLGLLILMVSFTQVIMISNNYYCIVSNTLNYIASALIFLSFPLFIIGVYKLYKEHKNKKEKLKIFSLLLNIITVFGITIILYSSFLLFLLMIFHDLGQIIIFFIFIIVSILVMSFYVKWLLRSLKLNFLIILSIILPIISIIIYALVPGLF